MDDNRIALTLDADTRPFHRAIAEAEGAARGFGATLTGALAGAAVRGRGLESVMRSLVGRLSTLAVNAAFRPLEQGFGALFSGALGEIGRVTPFAKGGVIGAPTGFPLGGGAIGLAGEAGPEAILPLARGADGRLGVRSGAGPGPVSVVVNVSTPDVAGFARAEAEIAASLARAVARGRRGS